jgi:hypothetical protein
MINTILFIFLDLILAAIAYLLFEGVFIPTKAKAAVYAKLKAKEREELDRRLDLNHYFGAHADDPADSGDPENPFKGLKPADMMKKAIGWKKKKIVLE